MRCHILTLAALSLSLVLHSSALAQSDNSELRQLEARITMLESTIEHRDARIAELEAKVAEQSQTIAALEAEEGAEYDQARESEANRRVCQQLQAKQTFELSGIKLEDALQYISHVAGVNIHVKWSTLNAAGVDRNNEVSIRLIDVPVEKALLVILEDVAGIDPLGFYVDEGVITISTQSDLDQNMQTAEGQEGMTVCVVRVVDGDTIVVSIDDEEATVRLIGVDTPETKHPNKPVEVFGKEASAFTTNLLAGEKVRLVIDPQQGETDRYGRMLAYVYREPDGLFVNAEIVRQGYGHCYRQYPFEYLEEFERLEQLARQAEKGLWGLKDSSVEPAPTPAEQPPAPVAPVTPTVTEQPKVQPDQGEVTVYITRTGAKYHRSGCRYLAKSSNPISLNEAKKRYTPCSVCKPPQ